MEPLHKVTWCLGEPCTELGEGQTGEQGERGGRQAGGGGAFVIALHMCSFEMLVRCPCEGASGKQVGIQQGIRCPSPQGMRAPQGRWVEDDPGDGIGTGNTNRRRW